MHLKKESVNKDISVTEIPNDKKNNNSKKLSYSVIAAYDGLILDKNDMKSIYYELKAVKTNINRSNMDNIKTILTSKLNLELPISRKYQLEHLTIPYTNDQISSPQKENLMMRNLILLHIYLTKWQCSSWFNIFKNTHEKFIEYVNNNSDSSTYKSKCLAIFKNELFYFCNSRTVTLYLKKNEKCNNINDVGEISDMKNDNIEEYLLSNRYVKPGIFDSILPQQDKSFNNIQSIYSINKSHHSVNGQTLTTSDKYFNLVIDVMQNKNVIINKEDKNDNNSNNNINNICSNKKLNENINNSDDNNSMDLNEYYCSAEEKESSEKDIDEENEIQNKDFYIFQYNIPKTFNSLQIESLTRFFIK
eukprot:jgi/Orpsp1_1/1178297/evm.model.c7180000064756.1